MRFSFTYCCLIFDSPMHAIWVTLITVICILMEIYKSCVIIAQMVDPLVPPEHRGPGCVGGGGGQVTVAFWVRGYGVAGGPTIAGNTKKKSTLGSKIKTPLLTFPT